MPASSTKSAVVERPIVLIAPGIRRNVKGPASERSVVWRMSLLDLRGGELRGTGGFDLRAAGGDKLHPFYFVRAFCSHVVIADSTSLLTDLSGSDGYSAGSPVVAGTSR